MGRATTRAAYFLARILGIDLQGHHRPDTDGVTQDESIQPTDDEEPPTVEEWLKSLSLTRKDALEYTRSLFPFVNWIGHYNLTWLVGDAVAGITIGAIVIPQGMAYALLANLEPQYGLYSAFTGPVLYWLFATTKDVSIGPVAVVSTLVGNVVNEVKLAHPEYPAHVIASALSVIAGIIVAAIGLLRCGWIVDLISLTSLSAFMTGSAITIAVGQLPTLLGISSSVDSREAPYLVFLDTWEHLGDATPDAAMGLTALAALYAIRSALMTAAGRWPRHRRLLFFLNTLRSVFVIVLYTVVSWLVNMSRKGDPAFQILGPIPRGFRAAGPPVLDTTLLASVSRFLPAAVIVLLVEHMAISKSFGRINNYVVDPSQEMVAIGVSNILGPFIGAYPATGSFSRTAINSKAGVRTPASGLIAAAAVLLATYTLTSVFFYIPSASLAAVIIHAVADLVTAPNTVYQFWLVSPLEVLIFLIGVLASVFSSIESGIYATVCISAAVLLLRVLRARGTFLAKVEIHSALGDHVVSSYGTFVQGPGGGASMPLASAPPRNVFLPISHDGLSSPHVDLQSPHRGEFIYRFAAAGFSYPNAASTLEHFLAHVLSRTRRTTPATHDSRAGDRPWNEPGPAGPKRAQTAADAEREDLPRLRAVVLDFSAVDHVDATAVQRLVDVRDQLDRYAAPGTVAWHVACVGSRWTRRALVSAGFGLRRGREEGGKWRSVFSAAGAGRPVGEADAEASEKAWSWGSLSGDGEDQRGVVLVGEDRGRAAEGVPLIGAAAARATAPARQRRKPVAHGLYRPLFHVDLTSAVQAAITDIEAAEETGVGQVQTVPGRI